MHFNIKDHAETVLTVFFFGGAVLGPIFTGRYRRFLQRRFPRVSMPVLGCMTMPLGILSILVASPIIYIVPPLKYLSPVLIGSCSFFFILGSNIALERLRKRHKWMW